MDEGAKIIKRDELHELVWKEPLSRLAPRWVASDDGASDTGHDLPAHCDLICHTRASSSASSRGAKLDRRPCIGAARRAATQRRSEHEVRSRKRTKARSAAQGSRRVSCLRKSHGCALWRTKGVALGS